MTKRYVDSGEACIEDYTEKRYKDIELPICSHKCYKDEDDRCPIVCKRVGEND